ncbi:MAG: DUF2062 domain-containing protein [Burkholderiaceae bacterium]
MPNVDKVREVKALSMFGDSLFHPALWHLNRRSAAGGVAIGLFCGLLPPPLQMLSAGIVCVFLRVNLPLALVTTLYTNPLTVVPLYLLAYQIGSLTLGVSGRAKPPPVPDWDWTNFIASADTMGRWMMSLGTPLVLGTLILATILAALGYVAVRGIWSMYLRRAWAARKDRWRE